MDQGPIVGSSFLHSCAHDHVFGIPGSHAGEQASSSQLVTS